MLDELDMPVYALPFSSIVPKLEADDAEVDATMPWLEVDGLICPIEVLRDRLDDDPPQSPVRFIAPIPPTDMLRP